MSAKRKFDFSALLIPLSIILAVALYVLGLTYKHWGWMSAPMAIIFLILALCIAVLGPFWPTIAQVIIVKLWTRPRSLRWLIKAIILEQEEELG